MVIGICGLIGSGKGTVADMLVREFGYTKLSFADSLKDAVAAVFGWPRDMLEGDTAQSRAWRDTPDEWWARRLDMPGLTPRKVLQLWGTEVCRQNWHNDIWILSIERKIRDIRLLAAENYTYANIVIPDTRFPNEIETIQKLGGKIWMVKRGTEPKWFIDYRDSGIIPSDQHASEYMWAKSQFDAVIENDSDIDALALRVRELVNTP